MKPSYECPVMVPLEGGGERRKAKAILPSRYHGRGRRIAVHSGWPSVGRRLASYAVAPRAGRGAGAVGLLARARILRGISCPQADPSTGARGVRWFERAQPATLCSECRRRGLPMTEGDVDR